MTTQNEIKGWSGMELVVGMEVQVDPAAKGDENEVGMAFDFTGHQELVRIYANGDDVQVKDWQGKKIRATRLQVRPKMITEGREILRNEKMNETHEFAHKTIEKSLKKLKEANYEAIVKLGDAKDAYDSAYLVRQYAEQMIENGMRLSVLYAHGIGRAVEAYLKNEKTLQELIDDIDVGVEAAMTSALRSPNRHNCTCQMTNLEEEIKHAVTCELAASGKKIGWVNWSDDLVQMPKQIQSELKRIAEEW